MFSIQVKVEDGHLFGGLINGVSMSLMLRPLSLMGSVSEPLPGNVLILELMIRTLTLKPSFTRRGTCWVSQIFMTTKRIVVLKGG